jgi:hypothetical protein
MLLTPTYRCRQIAPFYERLAVIHQEVVFLSIDTENEHNKSFFQSSGVRAFPTFEVRADGKLLKRIEGANPGLLEKTVVEASAIAEDVLLQDVLLLSSVTDEDDDVDEFRSGSHQHTTSKPPVIRPLVTQKFYKPSDGPIKVFVRDSRKKVMCTLEVDLSLPLSSFMEQMWETAEISPSAVVATYCGIILDERRSLKRLYELGFSSNTSVLLLSKPKPVAVNLKIGEIVQSLKLPALTTLRSLRRKAREFTCTSAPKLIYLGRILAESDDGTNLSSLTIGDGSTILCIPSGETWSVEAEKLEENLPENEVAVSSFSKHCSPPTDAGLGVLSFLPKSLIWTEAEKNFELGRNVPNHLRKVVEEVINACNMRSIMIGEDRVVLSQFEVSKEQ